MSDGPPKPHLGRMHFMRTFALNFSGTYREEQVLQQESLMGTRGLTEICRADVTGIWDNGFFPHCTQIRIVVSSGGRQRKKLETSFEVLKGTSLIDFLT